MRLLFGIEGRSRKEQYPVSILNDPIRGYYPLMPRRHEWMIVEVEKFAAGKLSLLKEVVAEIDLKFDVNVGKQFGYGSNLNYKVSYANIHLRPDFHVTDYLPTDVVLAKEILRNEFAKYLLVIGWKP